jgi:spore maturation protein CgeB
MNGIKNALKGVGWINAINAAIKARGTRAEYSGLIRHYRNRHSRKLPTPSLTLASGAPRIFFVGTDEQQDRSGIIQALQSFSDVRLFSRADGSYGQNDPRPEKIRRHENASRLWTLICQEASKGWVPDLVISQTWSTLIDPLVFDQIRARFDSLIINIGMDDRHQFRGSRIGNSWGGTLGLVGHIDLALTAAPECVAWYEKEGCPALFFPEASDPAIFHPMPDLPKCHEVSFVGGCYGIRRDLVIALRQAGIQVTAYGSGWESGRLDTEEVPRLFAQSKIILGVGTIGHCSDFYALKMRDFDAPMSGSLYITHDNPDLQELFQPGKEIGTFTTMEDCVRKVRHYLIDDQMREETAANGRIRALRDHTWTGRFQNLFSQLGLASLGTP